jgi:hypothetical protein
MAAKTMRNLASGSGTVSTTTGSKALTFSANQEFKKGATVVIGSQLFTIQEGNGTIWQAVQAATATVSGQSFTTTDTSTSKARGFSGVLVPDASVNFYFSHQDDSGNADYFLYGDTVFPEKGVHPYTYESYVGSVLVARSTDSPGIKPIDRVRLLEGAIRGSTGSIIGNPDARLDAIEGRLSPAMIAGSGQPSNSATSYYSAVDSRDVGQASDNAGNRFIAPRAGAIKNLYVQSDVAPGAAKTWTITVRKNGSDQTMVVTLTGASQTTGNDTAHPITVAAGDSISIKVAPTSTPAAARISWGMDFVVADAGDGGTVDTLLSRGDF